MPSDSSEQPSFTGFLTSGRAEAAEGTRGYQSTKTRVKEAATSVAGVAESVAYDILATGADLLQFAPVPALGSACSVLLSIWDAVQLIEINRTACLRLTERCAETLLSVHEEIRLAGSEAANELSEPMKKLHSTLQGVHEFLLKQKRRTFLQRYLKRDENQRDIANWHTSLDDALSLFNVKIQIRMLKLVQQSELRRQEDSKILGSFVAHSPSASTSVTPAVAPPGSFSATIAMDRMQDSVQIRWVLSSYRRAQSERDRDIDFVGLRQLLDAALQQHDDVAMIEVLQIGRDEMPEAIRTLQRVLQHDAEIVPHSRRHTLRIGEHRGSRNRLPMDSPTTNTDSFTLDAFDRTFIGESIQALTRLTLKQGDELKVPSWTITRHEIEIEKKIGIGFSSDVYRGRFQSQVVAIKILTAASPREFFVREINIWIRLQHPNVLKLLGASSTTGDPPWFLVSPYCAQGNLVHHLKTSAPGTLDDIVLMMREIAEGMHYLHAQGVLHGDLKASNILLDDSARCMISDFGQSEITSEAYRLDGLPRSPAGSFRWRSPELMMSSTIRLTPAIDIYAFGILCIEILSRGALPWPLLDDDAVWRLVCGHDQRPDLPPSCPQEHPISAVVQSAWQRDPSLRPSFRTIVQRLGPTNGTVGSRLPSHILAAIFEFVKQESFGEYEDMGDNNKECGQNGEWTVKVMGWVTFSHICHIWRQVALSTPGLWREIKFSHTGPKWAYEMVQRSKVAPLHVELGLGQNANPYWPSEEVLRFADHVMRSQPDRIRTLTIFGENTAPLAIQLFTHDPFPSMKFVHIENTSRLLLALSVNVLVNRVPKAAELCVIGVLFRGTPSAPLEHLTYFDLQVSDVVDPESVYDWNLLDILGGMPALQHLYITDAYPPSSPPQERKPIVLAKPLETLTLTARRFPSEMAQFSEFLQHPTTFRDFDFSDAEPEVIARVLERQVGTERPPRSIYLELDHAQDKVIFSASFSVWPTSEDGNTPTPLNDVSLTVSGLEMHAEAFMKAIDFREVQDLTFMDDDEVNAPMPWKGFATANATKRMRVIGPAAHALFDILMTPPDESDPESVGNMFPALEALSIIEMPEQAPIMGQEALREADRLLAAVSARRERGKPIRDLKVPDRLLEGEWLDTIRQHVEKVGGSRPRFY
ncbi:unnamed protein product [Peniophora sp. CBMAI 1063]|nr:unnamed protein product [Peniophora sp. CBMAI 1063]